MLHLDVSKYEIDIFFFVLFIVSRHFKHQIYTTTGLHNRSLETV